MVGAGPSGLAAAWRLRQQGFRPIVLEERDRVGGQLLTVKQDGFLMEAGTTILPAAYGSVMRLVHEAGLAEDLLPADSGMGFVRDGEMHLLRANHLLLDAARTRLLSLRSKLSAAKIGRDILRVRSLLSYEDLSAAAEFDVETPAEYAARRGLSAELYDYLIDPIARGGAGVPGDKISVVEFFFLMEKVLGSRLYALREGYSQLPEALAAQLPDVRLGVRVREVVEAGDGVEVTYETADGTVTERAAGAVVSSMGNRVPDIVPQLAPERARFLRDLTYTSCISINLALSRRPAAKPAFVVVPRPVSDGLFAVILEHNKVAGRCPDDKGLATLFTVNEWAVEHMDQDDDAVLAAILGDAERAVPDLGRHIEFVRVNRWNPVLVYSHPGLYREMRGFHAGRDLTSRIHLAGSYNSSGNVNTATVAGERAARELAAALRSPLAALERS
ncbi:MAG TPA: NAD(P)/FAD-dependent oxidoreductase [Nocardioides sp.]|nr:NAD(P)/FAD-dependent oxidoreductase [Nocardioides sp.]